MFRFALVDAENAESLGVVVFARPDFKPGDVIPQGHACLRVVHVLESEREDRLPVLVLQDADGNTMIAEAPTSSCNSDATAYRRNQMAQARAAVKVCANAEVMGVAFFAISSIIRQVSRRTRSSYTRS